MGWWGFAKREQLRRTVPMTINSARFRHDPSMEPIKKVQRTIWLGDLLHKQAESKPEITRRLGEATGLFKSLNHPGDVPNPSATGEKSNWPNLLRMVT